MQRTRLPLQRQPALSGRQPELQTVGSLTQAKLRMPSVGNELGRAARALPTDVLAAGEVEVTAGLVAVAPGVHRHADRGVQMKAGDGGAVLARDSIGNGAAPLRQVPSAVMH